MNFPCKSPKFQVTGYDPFRKRFVVTHHRTIEAAANSAAHRGRQIDVRTINL